MTDKSGIEFAPHFKNLKGTVPCGPYNIVLRHATFDNPEQKHLLYVTKKQVFVTEKEMWLTFRNDPNIFFHAKNKLANISRSPGSNYVFIGKVEPAPGPSETWVRFQQSFGDGYAEARVEADGSFKIYKTMFGKYLVYVVKDGKGVYSEQLELEFPRNIHIQLPKKSPVERSIKTTGLDWD